MKRRVSARPGVGDDCWVIQSGGGFSPVLWTVTRLEGPTGCFIREVREDGLQSAEQRFDLSLLARAPRSRS